MASVTSSYLQRIQRKEEKKKSNLVKTWKLYQKYPRYPINVALMRDVKVTGESLEVALEAIEEKFNLRVVVKARGKKTVGPSK